MDSLQVLAEFIERNWFFLLIIGGLLMALWQQNQRQSFRASPDEFEDLIRTGIPIVAEFYSDT